jgi:RNA polymerase sigma-70 factor (ECF subfamily)
MMAKTIRITMPPHPACFDGIDAIRPLVERAFAPGSGDWRLVPVWANRQPAAVSYFRAPGDTEFRVVKIDVLRIRGGLVEEITTFDESLVEAFGLSTVLRA